MANERTFPANMPEKVTTKLESAVEFQKRRLAPAASNRKKDKEASPPPVHRPALSSAAETVRSPTTYAPSLSVAMAGGPRSLASSNVGTRGLASGAAELRKGTLNSSQDNRYASTVRGTTAHTTVIGACLSTPPTSKERGRADTIELSKSNEIYARLSTDPGDEKHRNQMWRVNEV